MKISTTSPDLMEKKHLRPSTSFPNWFKKLKPEHLEGTTAKKCPGLIDLFANRALVVPLWATYEFQRCNKEGVSDINGLYIRHKTEEGYQCSYHDAGQVDGVGAGGTKMLPKPLCPWYLETQPGWSTLVLPASVHNERSLCIEPIVGVIHTDKWHQMHMPCKWTRNPDHRSVIEENTPFAYWIPFKREKNDKLTFELIEHLSERHYKVHGDVEKYKGERSCQNL